MSQAQATQLADQAHAALDRHAWREAFDLLAEADGRGSLTPDELELLAQAAWWTGQLPLAIDARERGYAAAVKAGSMEAAVEAAVNLARDNLFRNATAVANAWLNRAERLLEGHEEGRGHGWLAATRSFHDALVGNRDSSLAHAVRALEIARRLGDRDMEAIALSEKGAALLVMGQVEEGLAAVDEATVAAVGGELDPIAAGGVCCTTIEACAAMGDWRRAAEWTEAQDRWCRREGINGYPGMCRLFRSEVKRLHGDWIQAESEARRASEELSGFMPAAVGLALYQVGEIKLRRGDYPAAEEALLRAHAFGHDPEPALSLLRLAQGSVPDAAASIKRALDEPPRLPSWRAPPASALYRIPLLSARAEIALAGGDVPTARAAVDELSKLAEPYDTVPVRAGAATTLGAVQAAEGDREVAAQTLRGAVQAWVEFDAPYEAARTRMTLAQVYAAGDQRARAAVEAEIARDAFEQLGAIPDLRRAEALLATVRDGASRPAGGPARRTVRSFVFTDIVDSTRLAELVGDEAWARLIRWHDEALRAVVADNGGTEIKATGDGFFLAFDAVDRAIDAAVAIQRRLAEQRTAQGFAPTVRIGVHTAEAQQAGLDYIGTGVNQASRIGAAAGGDEILVSATSLAGTRRSFPELGRRTVELKGIAAPVEVVSIDWR